MNDRIAKALEKLFDRHRVVFWYDTKQELRPDFEALELPNVEKIEIQNNEFGIKYRILREAPTQKFLLYKNGPQPEDLKNWLLDVQLAQGQFRTDQVGLWLSELDLGLEFADLIQEHSEFCQALKRREALQQLLKADDTPRLIRLKMLAVCVNEEPRVDAILEALLAELADHKNEKINLIHRCSLEPVLWQQMERLYGYCSETPSIQDFAIELFKSCYAMGTDGDVHLSGDALVFLKRWKDSRRYENVFKSLSQDYAKVLNIGQDLEHRDFRQLLELDYFSLIDQKIIRDLVQGVVDRTIAYGEVNPWIRQRRQSCWYSDYHHLYAAIDNAAQFLQSLNEASLTIESMADGIQRYCQTWFRIDQFYRKFTFHVRKSGQTSLMHDLTTQIENLYSNHFLLPLNDLWQAQVDATSHWSAIPVVQQSHFFRHWVQPFLQKDKKVCVIISDALRYEIGEELAYLIRQEDRYEAHLEAALAMLPSYTQLGMAALLPHETLSFAPVEDSSKHNANIYVDGLSSQGTINRGKLLDRARPDRAKAIQAEDLLKMNRDESRSLFREHDVVYIYHNRIDKVGDTRDSEDRVFEAAEDTCQDLILLVKKLTAANASNLLVTADHGFLYQSQALDISDFSGSEPKGREILFQNRRFVLGRGLQVETGLRKFFAAELGLAGDLEVLIPKSINRLRLKGSGSRFVHGGATLQEIVIPVIHINKKRQSDVTMVEVEILRNANSIITTGQLAVSFYQTEPVTAKVQARTLRAGIYNQHGELISDSHDLRFDFVSENPREREIPVRFVLTRKADQANHQDVILRLEEQVSGTSHYQEYKSLRYLMRSSFTREFDFEL